MDYQIIVRISDVEHTAISATGAEWGDVLTRVDECSSSGVFNRFTVRCQDGKKNVVVDFDRTDWQSPRARLCAQIVPGSHDSNAYGG